MKRVLALIALGLLGPMVQGALAPYLPRGACPDAGLLLVLAIGLSGQGALAGLVFTAFVGFVSDLLSGALLGSHALLWIPVFGMARAVSLHVNLQGGLAQMALAAGFTVFTAFGLASLTAFFGAAGARGLVAPVDLLRQAIANALLAPIALALVARLVARLADDDRRLLRLEPRDHPR